MSVTQELITTHILLRGTEWLKHLTRIHARVGVNKRHVLPLYTSHNLISIDFHRVNCNEPTPSLLDNF